MGILMAENRIDRRLATIIATDVVAYFLAVVAAGPAKTASVPEWSADEGTTTDKFPNPAAVFCVDNSGIYKIRSSGDR
jgi:hypothetical protein